MSLPIDLDEQSEDTLIDELMRRIKLQEKNLCDYCERGPDTNPCKFPTRHTFAHKNKRDYRGGRRVADKLREKLLARVK